MRFSTRISGSHKVTTYLVLSVLFFFSCGFYLWQRTSLYSVSSFPIGVAVNPILLTTNSAYRQIVETEFNSITSEGGLKWLSVHPFEDRFDFSEGDILVNFALEHNMRFHGHNLCWYAPNPAWLNNFQGDSTAWEGLLRTHITTVVSHYKGKIKGWDVVNEAFHSDGSLRGKDITTSTPDDNGGSLWERHLGEDYIARAFKYAHDADSSALLFYNDYDQQIRPGKLAAINKMVVDFKRRGIPIDGLGLQMHLTLSSPKEGIINSLKQSAATGLLIHISELDIRVNNNNKSSSYSDSLAQKQAALYAFVVQQYKMLVPKRQQYGITLWDVSDADSWVPKTFKVKDWPTLFGKNYKRKAIYYNFRKALQKT